MTSKLNNFLEIVKNKNILIQGLGLNGGGTGVALFFLKNGFNIRITDLKSESDLKKSIDILSSFSLNIEYVLGRHRDEDFLWADFVVKGPAVPPNNKYIMLAKNNGATISSDIDIFLNITPSPIFAITGSKGKSTTVSAIYSIFKSKSSNSYLGGNITISPLDFFDKLDENSLVILELSSWQLRDIANSTFSFKGSAITNILNDHQNYYNSIADYINDKIIITKNQSENDFLILPFKDNYLNSEDIKTAAKKYTFSIDDKNGDFFSDGINFYFRNSDKLIKLLDTKDIVAKGLGAKINILLAVSFCYLAGIDLDSIREGIKKFSGVKYRLDLIRELNGIKFYNDTTATIPEAVIQSIKSFDEPIIWIGGGNDKCLDFSVLKEVISIPKKIFLLTGDGSDKIKKILNENGIDFIEDSSLENLIISAFRLSNSGDIILFSPGATSFGLFQNEFHRGDVFNEIVFNLK